MNYTYTVVVPIYQVIHGNFIFPQVPFERCSIRGVGEGGAGGAVAPPTFESCGAQPLQFFTSLCAVGVLAPPLLNLLLPL